MSDVGERLYGFVWDYFCDWYLELSKGSANTTVLVHALRTMLRLLHPYCPFVTEELWEQVKPEGAERLIKEVWPSSDPKLQDKKASDQLQVVLQVVIDVITAIRKIRADHGIAPDKKISVMIHSVKWVELLESQEAHIRRLARVESLTFSPHQKHTNTASAILADIEIHVPLADMLDREKEREKLVKEQNNLRRLQETLSSRLADSHFLERAPMDIVVGEKKRLTEVEERQKKIAKILRNL
ncbi:class I tRNA ligase family protein [Candidatus Peregrinibacteria bacterium]|nr:class I tRNA ligase family protein [Candidatus Peregrinibacteria bacterium]